MANYTPTFTKPYPNGWVDKPSKTTPVTAAIMNSYDTAIAALEAYLRDNSIDTVSVSVEQFPSDGRQWLGTITMGSNQYRIYMPSLKYENSVSDGIKIGAITLGEQSFDVYAPASSTGGSTVSVVPKTLTGTNIAEITVDGTTYQLYAPTGGSGSGSTVTAEATLTEGTQIGKITIDGVETILYAPTASAITVDAELSATSENPVQNKVITEALNGILKVTDLSDKLKNGRYNDYSLNDDFSKCYKINNIIYGQLFITGLKDDEKPNKRILVAAFDEDYFKDRTSSASFFCGYLEMLESDGRIYSSDKNNRIQIPLVYDPINYEIEAISLEDDTLHFQSTTILSGYFRLITQI